MKISITPTSLQVTNASRGPITAITLLVIGGVIAWLLGSNQQNLLLGGGVGALFAAGAVAALLVSKSSTIRLDKSSDTITIQQKGLIGAATTQTATLSQVKAVLLDTSYTNQTSSDNSAGGAGGRTSTLSLALQDGSHIQLGSVASGAQTINGMAVGMLVKKAPLAAEAQQVADFLGLSVTVQDFSSVASAGQLFDALAQTVRGSAPAASQPPVRQNPAAPPPFQPPASPPPQQQSPAPLPNAPQSQQPPAPNQTGGNQPPRPPASRPN